ncbi:hypothetical protein, partial [Erwinia sp. PsM31]|uniref:hypothetical protein n=1 Tax=Erwinia sp. PsM31 TaxID=3030535 RepID=UPI00263BCA5C
RWLLAFNADFWQRAEIEGFPFQLFRQRFADISFRRKGQSGLRRQDRQQLLLLAGLSGRLRYRFQRAAL